MKPTLFIPILMISTTALADSTLVVPFVARGADTGWQGGVVSIFVRDNANSSLDSNRYTAVALGTERGQFLGVFANELNISANRRLLSNVSASYWQANYYGQQGSYAIVADQYLATGLGAGVQLGFKLAPNQWLDIGVIAQTENTEDLDSGNPTFNSSITGAGQLNYLGTNATWTRDNRNNRDWPSQGNWQQLSLTSFQPVTENAAQYNTFEGGARLYTEFGNTIFATAIRTQQQWGDVPFRKLATFNGSTVLRGFESGKQLDKAAWALQSEVRQPLGDRFAVTVFAETGAITGSLLQPLDQEPLSSIGLGLRWAPNPNPRINLRFDLAWVDGGLSPTIIIGEAF